MWLQVNHPTPEWDSEDGSRKPLPEGKLVSNCENMPERAMTPSQTPRNAYVNAKSVCKWARLPDISWRLLSESKCLSFDSALCRAVLHDRHIKDSAFQRPGSSNSDITDMWACCFQTAALVWSIPDELGEVAQAICLTPVDGSWRIRRMWSDRDWRTLK